MFTRRCSERRFFLRPDSMTNNAFWYCLGWAAQTHGIVLHAAVAMSNHVHVVATDPRGVYPNFLRDFHGLLARVVNAARGRWEHFWDANQASAVLLTDEAAQADKLAYVLANPVGLVKLAVDWPGALRTARVCRLDQRAGQLETGALPARTGASAQSRARAGLPEMLGERPQPPL